MSLRAAGAPVQFSLLDDDDTSKIFGSAWQPSAPAGGVGAVPAAAQSTPRLGGLVAPVGAAGSAPRKRVRENDVENAMVVAEGAVLAAGSSRRGHSVEESQLLMDLERHKHEIEVSQLTAEADKLRRQVKFLCDQEDAARSKAERREESLLAEQHRLSDELSRAESSAKALSSKCVDLEGRLEEQSTQRSKLQKLADAQTKAIEELRNSKHTAVQTLEQQLLAARNEAGRLPIVEEELRRVQLELSSSKNSTLGGASEDVEKLQRELITLRQGLEHSQRRERGLADEVQRIRSQRKNAEVLDSQLATALSRASKGEEAVKELTALKVRVAVLEEERHTLATAISGMVGGSTAGVEPSTPAGKCDLSSVLAFIRGMQDERLKLLGEKGTVEARLAVSQKNMDWERRRVSELEADLTRSDDRRIKCEESLLRLERRYQLLEKEKESLRRVLDSYSAEEAQLISMQRSGPSTGTPALTPSKAKDDEIAHLRTALEEANARIVELEKEASAMTSQAVTDTLHARIAALTSEVESKAKEAAKMTALVEKLEIENAKLISQVARGDFNPATTKVLRMQGNPLGPPVSEDGPSRLQELEDEVASLRRRLGGSGSDEGPMISEAESKKRMSRIKEIFMTKVQEYRDVWYLLTGYKMDMWANPSNGCTELELKSIYAENREDSLRIMKREDGLHLIVTDFTKTLDTRITAYLTRFHSFPAFLANVTLDLFERQTFLGAS